MKIDLFDGDHKVWTGTLAEFIGDNADDPIAAEDIAAIKALEGNEQHRMFPGFTVQAA